MSFIASTKGSKQTSNVHQTSAIWGNPKHPRCRLAELITGDSDVAGIRTKKEDWKMHSEDRGGRRQSLL